ncbi:MAG TPA: helix-turn-helix domain-containing protein [Xanthobacteraceae bacterium]|nr:helix-turn-helix domain-containing protein [Xanthobacteraceae bacterium]
MSDGRKRQLSGCPIDYGLDVFGDRWTLLVIRDLLFAGKRHFKELMESPERIASNILAARLKKLEERGLIERCADPENRKQVIYTLSDKGRDLAPVLVEMIRWGGRHDPETLVPKSFVTRLARNNDQLIADVRAGMAEAARKVKAKARR